MNRQKILIVISIISIIAILGGAYWFFSKKTIPVAKPLVTFPGEGKPATNQAGTETGGNGTGSSTFIPGSGATLPRLYELHKLPVAGVGFMEMGLPAVATAQAGTSTYHTVTARYIERGLGHIYETKLATLVDARIVNETRSRIMEALWGNGGKSVVIRFIDETNGSMVIKTSILNLGITATSFASSTTDAYTSDFIKTEEVLLPDYIPFVATAEDRGDKLFYLEKGASGSTGFLATFKNVGLSAIFNSAFTEWLPQFPNQQLITLTTKPSAEIPGHLFFVDPKTKSVTKILGGINGLTTLTSHDGKFVLFSETKNDVPELSLYDVVANATRPLLLQTLPEKCVWGFQNSTLVYCTVPQTIPKATYPDQWYQGLVSFSDAVWEIDTTTGLTKKIMTPSELGAPPLDMVTPVVSQDGTYLAFINKVTGTPWVYRISTEIAPVMNTFTTTTTQSASTTEATPSTRTN